MLSKNVKLAVRHFCILMLAVLVVGCSCKSHCGRIKLPPVTEGWRKSSAAKNAYIVQRRDTLYSIAWAFGLDYRDLIKINRLNFPYKLYHGQRLYLVSSERTNAAKNNVFSKSILLMHSKLNIKSSNVKSCWLWPVRGNITKAFDNKLGGNKGIDILGNYGDPVFAGNSGTIVYSGTGIRSYGKLIIIKHSDDYLSAYAYSSRMLVKEGQHVCGGQKIAIIGRDNSGNFSLHFEIRKFGKPINPLLYLPH